MEIMGVDRPDRTHNFQGTSLDNFQGTSLDFQGTSLDFQGTSLDVPRDQRGPPENWKSLYKPHIVAIYGL